MGLRQWCFLPVPPSPALHRIREVHDLFLEQLVCLVSGGVVVGTEIAVLAVSTASAWWEWAVGVRDGQRRQSVVERAGAAHSFCASQWLWLLICGEHISRTNLSMLLQCSCPFHTR